MAADGIISAVNAVIADLTPIRCCATTFDLSGSSAALGGFGGSSLAAMIAAAPGFRVGFIVVGAMLLARSAAVMRRIPPESDTAEPDD